MAKAKYKKNARGEFETKIWDGTYNPDGSKHRKRLVSKKSSADLERQVSQLKNSVENGQYVQKSDILFLDYAREWLAAKKGVREKNTQAMYRNVIERHLSFLEGVRLTDIRNSHFQLAINNALDKPRTCQQISLPKLAKKEKRPLTAVERDAIGKADFTDRERAFVYLIYSCGLRRGEALALSIFDFHLGDGQATVSITKSLIFDGNAPEIKDMPKTENGFRTLPIPGSTAGLRKGYMAGGTPGEGGK